jgi:hypothetical protein
MTVDAGVSCALGQMTVSCLHLLDHILMAFHTNHDTDLAGVPFMTGGTTFTVGFMQFIANHCLSATPMGTVTGQTFTQFARIIAMLGFEISFIMTSRAQFILGCYQQHREF